MKHVRELFQPSVRLVAHPVGVGGGQSQAAAVRRLRAGTIFEMTGFGLVLACMVIIGAGLAGSSLF